MKTDKIDKKVKNKHEKVIIPPKHQIVDRKPKHVSKKKVQAPRAPSSDHNTSQDEEDSDVEMKDRSNTADKKTNKKSTKKPDIKSKSSVKKPLKPSNDHLSSDK